MINDREQATTRYQGDVFKAEGKEEQERIKDEAKKLEADQWISNTVFNVVKRSGTPMNRNMSMRWILTWKKDRRRR